MYFKIISFDLFNTLVYLDGGEVSRKKVLQHTYDSFKENYPKLNFLRFFNIYMEKWKNHLKVKPPYLEKNHLYLMNDILNEILDDKNSESNISVARKAVKIYFNEMLKYVRLFPYVEKTLSNLSKKYPLVLVSDHSYAKNGYDVLNKFNLTKYFSKIVFSDEIGYRKPSKIIFDYAFKDFLISDRNEILHIGDKYQLDVEGIINYGGKAIWIKQEKNDFNSSLYIKNKKIICVSNSFKDIYILFFKNLSDLCFAKKKV